MGSELQAIIQSAVANPDGHSKLKLNHERAQQPAIGCRLRPEGGK
jgi:hypothetical protein